ncbi:hypothetical protein [Pimelobacter simplex]|uniref:hypothetical protein n=1 Tax=Nocardioides simplex TaxID=2045 RepID=UPI003AB09627
MYRHTRRLAGAVLTTSALTLGLLVTTSSPATAADPTAIPQAPVITVIASSETLPFSRVAGQPTEVAVLTAGQSLASASWTTTDQLALAPYQGQKIRVLARQQGVTDPAGYFDATYDVRDAYESAVGLGTPHNPPEAVLASAARVTGWATGYTNYLPGPNVTDNWKTPENAVGSIAGNPDDPYSGNTTVVVLGDHGQITMTFANPIFDGPGYDFAVFENGFRVSGQLLDFIELGRVQVSSNGTDFVEFDTGTTNTSPVAAYGGAPANKYGGIAGRDLNSYGTPFDLTALRNKTAVRSGKVDLDKITAVKIVDIVGDGNDLDSFGRPIYDSFPTYGSGGFDLRAVGAMNQRAAAVNPAYAKGLDSSTVSISTAVSSGEGGALTVDLEVADTQDGTGAVVADSGTVAAGQQGKPFDFRVRDVAAGRTFWYRVAVKDAGGQVAAATDWKSFTKTPGTVALSSTPSCNRTQNAARCYFSGAFQSNTDGPFVRWVELSEDAEHTSTWTVGRTEAQSGAIIAEGQHALELGRTYHYRYVGELSDGVRRTSAWGTFQASVAPSVVTPVLVARTADEITFTSAVNAGSAATDKVLWQYTSGPPSFRRDVVDLPAVALPHGADTTTFTRTIAGLAPGSSYNVRAVIEREDGSRINGNPLSITVETPPAPLVSSVTRDPADGRAVSVLTRTNPHTYGEQSIVLEHTDQADKSGVTRTDAVLESSTVAIVPVAGLAPGTTYWVRARWTSTAPSLDGHEVTTDWFEFSTPALTTALGTPTTANVSRTGASVSVPVTPGAFERSVRVGYRVAGGPAHYTDAQVVPSGPAVTVPFTLDGLDPNTGYSVWATSSATGTDDTETGDAVDLRTAKAAVVLGSPVVSGLSHRGATVTTSVTPGDAAQRVWLEYSLKADHSGAVSTGRKDVAAGDLARPVAFDLDGLAADTAVYYRVRAEDADGDDAATAWARLTTVKPAAPSVSVTVPPGAYRVGDKVRVSWSAADVDTLTASGDWSGVLDPAGGSREVTLGHDGAFVFTATGTGTGGRTEVSARVEASYAAARLTVATDDGPFVVGRPLTVLGSGLAGGEAYSITIGGITAETGRADSAGRVTRTVRVPTALAEGAQRVVVTGSVADRTGTATVRVLRAKRLGVQVPKTVRAGKKARVRVTGLAAGESATIRVLGRTYRGTANADGVVVKNVKIPAAQAKRAGKARTKVVVRGAFGARKGTATFRVTK